MCPRSGFSQTDNPPTNPKPKTSTKSKTWSWSARPTQLKLWPLARIYCPPLREGCNPRECYYRPLFAAHSAKYLSDSEFLCAAFRPGSIASGTKNPYFAALKKEHPGYRRCTIHHSAMRALLYFPHNRVIVGRNPSSGAGPLFSENVPPREGDVMIMGFNGAVRPANGESAGPTIHLDVVKKTLGNAIVMGAGFWWDPYLRGPVAPFGTIAYLSLREFADLVKIALRMKDAPAGVAEMEAMTRKGTAKFFHPVPSQEERRPALDTSIPILLVERILRHAATGLRQGGETGWGDGPLGRTLRREWGIGDELDEDQKAPIPDEEWSASNQKLSADHRPSTRILEAPAVSLLKTLALDVSNYQKMDTSSSDALFQRVAISEPKFMELAQRRTALFATVFGDIGMGEEQQSSEEDEQHSTVTPASDVVRRAQSQLWNALMVASRTTSQKTSEAWATWDREDGQIWEANRDGILGAPTTFWARDGVEWAGQAVSENVLG